MVSDKQHKANRHNSATGGVKTSEGKAVSRFNAITHGILRESITEYEKGFYEDVLQDLQDNYNPVGIIEQILVERIALHYLKLFRVQKAENEYMKAKLNPEIVKYGFELASLDKVVKKGYTPKINSEHIEQLLNIFSRYETTIENRLFRAMHELERAQRARKGETLQSPLMIDVNQMGSFRERSENE